MMKEEQKIKEKVKEKYSMIARENPTAGCCGSGGCCGEVYTIMSDDYTLLKGYEQSADLGLGCGLPTQFARIRPGDTVLDLGCGAGNDCFIARSEAGSTGRIIGVDFSTAMLEKARKNAAARGLENVEFRLGDIEELPVESDSVDVVVSNCVLNLVPGKQNVFREIFRVLRPGGHFSISDIVLEGLLPESMRSAVELYVGCVAGAIPREEYLAFITDAGFRNLTVQKEKAIEVPEPVLAQYLDAAALEDYLKRSSPIRSVTIYAEKPE